MSSKVIPNKENSKVYIHIQYQVCKRTKQAPMFVSTSLRKDLPMLWGSDGPRAKKTVINALEEGH